MHELQRPQGKTEWPELVGRDVDEAKTVIQQYGFHVVLVPLGSVMTMDFRQNRVRVSRSCCRLQAAGCRLPVSWLVGWL